MVSLVVHRLETENRKGADGRNSVEWFVDIYFVGVKHMFFFVVVGDSGLARSVGPLIC